MTGVGRDLAVQKNPPDCTAGGRGHALADPRNAVGRPRLHRACGLSGIRRLSSTSFAQLRDSLP
jgi:hypothetical protein